MVDALAIFRGASGEIEVADLNNLAREEAMGLGSGVVLVGVFDVGRR